MRKSACAIVVMLGMLPGAVMAQNAAADHASGNAEVEPAGLTRVVAVEQVCAWPNLTRLRDGTIAAIIHNQPSHGTMEGDVDCWASTDGLKWEKRGTATRHEPNTIRMNAAAGLAKNGDLVVLCSGWTNEKQPNRPKQAPFRDAILRSWVCRSADGGRTWQKRTDFPAPQDGWTEYIPFGDIWVAEVVSFGAAQVTLLVHQFRLQRAEEALDHRVVVAIAGAAHARLQAVGGQQPLVVVAGVLHAAIAVVQHRGRRVGGAGEPSVSA